ncbi:MAG TPA: hypothetical protein VL134_03885 [Leptolyngbya sp.]|jgi:hypothetical protein|nr:hypothetical protein [Leptolyngbya sp.]
MNTLKRLSSELCRAAVLVLLLGIMLIAPMQAAHAAGSYSSGAAEAQSGKRDLMGKINRDIQRDDSDRPKTTGEWNREARETAGEPGKRFDRIAKETGEAVKDLGQIYPDTAERSGDALQESLDRTN